MKGNYRTKKCMRKLHRTQDREADSPERGPEQEMQVILSKFSPSDRTVFYELLLILEQSPLHAVHPQALDFSKD